MEHINHTATELTFTIKRWSAWLPDQSVLSYKQGWPNGRNLATSSSTPNLGFLPLIQRRRLTPLARAAIAVAWDCWQPGDQLPTIFCSTHGETSHCFDILSVMADNQEVSPTQFTLSVHSGIAAMFSILTDNHAAYIVMAPGADIHSNALLEAYGLICEHNSEVLIVFYDQPIPEIYRPKTPSPSMVSALALRLTKPDQLSDDSLFTIVPSQIKQNHNDGKSLERIITAICKGQATIETEHWYWKKSFSRKT